MTLLLWILAYLAVGFGVAVVWRKYVMPVQPLPHLAVVVCWPVLVVIWLLIEVARRIP